MQWFCILKVKSVSFVHCSRAAGDGGVEGGKGDGGGGGGGGRGGGA